MKPSHNPEGRFHHDRQTALYTSCTAEGARASLGYYAQSDDPSRLIVELEVTRSNLFDLRDEAACSALSLSYEDSRIRWQDERTAGVSATPWKISDAVRDTGADGMIYPSSSHPVLFHMVLFRWNALGGAKVKVEGAPKECTLM